MLKNTRLRMTTLFIISILVILAILFLIFDTNLFKMMLNIHLKKRCLFKQVREISILKKLMVSLYMLPNKI